MFLFFLVVEFSGKEKKIQENETSLCSARRVLVLLKAKTVSDD